MAPTAVAAAAAAAAAPDAALVGEEGGDALGDDLDLDEDLDELWDCWAERWRQEFQKFNENEDERLKRLTEQVHRIAVQEARACEAAAEAAIAGSDQAARLLSQVSGEVVEAQRARAVKRLEHDAAHGRREACNAARQDTDDLARSVMESAAQRRLEREAKRKEARRAREAELEARFRQPLSAAAPPPPAGASAAGNVGFGRHAPPPRFTRTPGTGDIGGHAVGEKGKAARRPAEAPFASWEVFDAAWRVFERQLKACASGPPLRCADVPWPNSLPSVSGVQAADSPSERNRKFRAAVLRWHPDKWGPVLALVPEEERPEVVDRVQAVTRRILEERKRFGG